MKTSFHFFGVFLVCAALAALTPSSRGEVTSSAPPVYYGGPTAGSLDATGAEQMSEVMKLIQAKVDPAVIKSYIENSPVAFQPTADDLITLKNAGATPEVLKALVDHAAAVRSQAAQTGSQSSYTVSSQTAYPSSPQTYYPASQNSDTSDTSYGATVYPTTYYASYSYGYPWYVGLGWYWPSYYYGYYPYCYRGCYYGYYHGCYRYPYYGYHGYYPYGYASSGYYHNHNNQNWAWYNGGNWKPGATPNTSQMVQNRGAHATPYMTHNSMAGYASTRSPVVSRPASVSMNRGPSIGRGASFTGRSTMPVMSSGARFSGGGGGMHFNGGGGGAHFGGGSAASFGGGGMRSGGGGFGGGGFRH